MKNNLLLTAFICLISISTGAAQHRNCGTMDRDAALQNLPGYSQERARIESEIQAISNLQSKSNMVITIPVVFHVIYKNNNSTENISTERIMDQLQVLNDDFTASNSDTSAVPSVFKSLIGNSNIQFCLAQRDPNGNATTGINRIQTTKNSFGIDDSMKFTSSGGQNAWPRASYLNIWVCTLNGGYLGYAQFPNSSPGAAATDGVVLLNESVGGPNFPGTATNYDLGRTATHEVGHWLNLYHIWGDSFCGNDQVSDTPTQQTANFGCPSFPNITCSNGPNGDMFMNYMDYVDDACMVMFSSGQGTRMNSAMSVAPRSSLVSSLGCVPPSSAPVAAFTASATTVCKYDAVTFTDQSTNTPTSWSWSFPGGTPSSSTAQNPVVTYNTTGTFNVTLTATNAGGSDPEVKTSYITVNGLPQVDVTGTGNSHIVCAASSLLLTANSVSPNLTYQWQRYGIDIPGATNATYAVTKTGNYKVIVTKPNGCSKLSTKYRVDKVPLPVVQLTAQGPTSFCPGGSVQLLATQNATWTYVWKKYANVIQGANTNSYIATESGAFKTIVTDTNDCVRSSPKIVVDATCRIAGDQDATALAVAPNPVSDQLHFSASLMEKEIYSVLLTDMTGREVEHFELVGAGEQAQVSLDVAELAPGLYFLSLRSADAVQTVRVVKR